MENHSLSASQTRETLVKDVGALKENAAKVIQDVKDTANAHVGETKQRVNDTIVTTREYFNAHPLSLLGAGFVVGLVFGLRLRR